METQTEQKNKEYFTYWFKDSEENARSILLSLGFEELQIYKGSITAQYKNQEHLKWFSFHCNPEHIINTNVQILNNRFIDLNKKNEVLKE